jgi:hypothetical protein
LIPERTTEERDEPSVLVTSQRHSIVRWASPTGGIPSDPTRGRLSDCEPCAAVLQFARAATQPKPNSGAVTPFLPAIRYCRGVE